MKKAIYCLILLLVAGFSAELLFSRDYRYQVMKMYDSNDQGQVLQQSPYSGWLLLSQNGTYKMQLHIYDEGTYKYVKANPQQKNDTIYFNSQKNFQFFAYSSGNALEVWLYKTETGTNRWVHAELTTGNPAASSGSTGSAGSAGTTAQPGNNTQITALIRNGVFTKKVIFGNTSMPAYHYYDQATGDISADEKGILLRPDGTYFLRSDLGSSVFEEHGNYRVIGNQIQVIFSDNSSMTLTIEEGGKSLRWYNQGMLISEYLFLGVIE